MNLARRWRSILILTLLVGGAESTATPSVARAGTYDIHSCRHTDGSPGAPIGDAKYGWQQETYRNERGSFVFANRCHSSDAFFSFRMGAQAGQLDASRGRWIFYAPAATSITRYEIYWAGRGRGDTSWVSDGAFTRSDLNDPNYVKRYRGVNWGTFFEPMAGQNRLAESGVNVSWLQALLACDSLSVPSCPVFSGDIGELRIFRSSVSLRDERGPRVERVAGSLAEAHTLSGTVGATVGATDEGGGVYRTLIEVDGKIVSSQGFDSNGGRCVDADPRNGKAHEFYWPVPCVLSGEGAVRLDTTRLANGAHTLRVLVEDAAGNRVTAIGPRRVEVLNIPQGAPNGAPAEDGARISLQIKGRRGLRARTGYRRLVTLSGRIMAGSRGIGGARLDVMRNLAHSSGFRRIKGVTTDPDGRFRFRTRAVRSAQLRLDYRSHSNDPQPDSSGVATVLVRAPVTLRRTPAVTRNGRLVRFSGRIRGSSRGRSRARVRMQARVRGRWKTFRTVRTDRRGRYRLRYRFRRTFRTQTYKFRALVPAQSRLPYAAGRSRSVRVKVRA